MHHRSISCAIFLIAPVFSIGALADQAGTATLSKDSFLSLETGTISGTGGDVLWNGSSLSPQGRAGIYNIGKFGSRAFKFLPARYASSVPFGVAAIPSDALVEGDVFGVHTNGGHYAKVMVTAVSGSSLSVSFTVFGVAPKPSASGPTPIINTVQNNYSYLLPGVPNYGIAPGSIFIITGSNLSSGAPPVLQSSAAPGLPLTLNGTGISVTVNGTTTTPAIYYTSSGQLAAVLPSTTPAGIGTLTVTYNGVPSAPARIQVVSTALGLDTLYGAGIGSAVATDGNGKSFGFTNAAAPNQEITLWGSGIGADAANDDLKFPQSQNNLTNIPMQIFIGGISANVAYRGRSQYPGLDQVNVTIPANVGLGCYVSVIAQSGSMVSNLVTLPISAANGPCNDTGLGMSGTQLQALAAKGASGVKALSAFVAQSTNFEKTATAAGAFASFLGGAELGAGYFYASPGNCTVFQHASGGLLQATPLDPGTLHLTSPAGNFTLQSQGGGQFGADLPATALTSSPGTYTFSGSGGANIGSFTTSVSVQAPFTLTNTAALANITRSQGATVTWSGGFPNGFVVIDVVGALGPAGSVNAFCYAPSNPGSFTIPAPVLLALPAGGGNLFITNSTSLQVVQATGLDLGTAVAAVSSEVAATLK
jgi:uncharacterized protein (TIGR03437 family)